MMKKFERIILIASTILISCLPERPGVNSNFFSEGISKGQVDNPSIDEASGLAASRSNPGFLWTHNDSGDSARIFLIDSLGKYKASVYLEGVNNRDWEDIAVGPGPDSTKSYIYLGEIGDNDAIYEFKYIYRFIEPMISQIENKISVLKFDSIKFTLPGGPRDTEALMIDPQTNDLYLFSKREHAINLYKLSYPYSTTETVSAEEVLSALPFSRIVAADFSADGNEILIKSYTQVFYWKRKNEPVSELLKKEAIILPYTVEPQGESIAFSYDGKGYYTISEKTKHSKPQMIFYKRVNSSQEND